MKKRSPPKAQAILLVVTALKVHIPSDKARCSRRESFNGVPNFRYQATTGGLPWTVDIYNSHYFRVQVGTQTGDVLKTVPELIGYLARNLGIVPAPPKEETNAQSA